MSKWFSANPAGDTTLVSIFDEIGVGDEQTAEQLVAAMNRKRLRLTINSLGGDTLTAKAVAAKVRQLDSTCRIVGRCNSAAVMIACSARHVAIESGASMCVHPVMTAVFGSAKQLRETADMLDDSDKEYIEILAAKTRQPVEVIHEWNSRDTYFTASEALAAGLVDEIVEPAPSSLAAFTQVAASGHTTDARTPEENLFWDIVHAIGPFSVGNRQNFLRELQALYAMTQEKSK